MKLIKKIPKLYLHLLRTGRLAEEKWTRFKSEKTINYLDDNNNDREWYVRFLLRLQPATVMEVGAGALHEVRRLRELQGLKSITYTSVDVSEEFLKRGRKEFPEVDFKKGNINRLKLPHEAYDIVFCKSVLEHQPYYDRPVEKMLRVAKSLVVMNLFRWSLHRDVIRRGKYYSNSYEIRAFLRFVQERSRQMEHFLIFKGETMGPNRYDDENIRRTGDHLVILAAKDDTYPLRVAYDVMDDHHIRYIARPYA